MKRYKTDSLKKLDIFLSELEQLTNTDDYLNNNNSMVDFIRILNEHSCIIDMSNIRIKDSEVIYQILFEEKLVALLKVGKSFKFTKTSILDGLGNFSNTGRLTYRELANLILYHLSEFQKDCDVTFKDSDSECFALEVSIDNTEDSLDLNHPVLTRLKIDD